MQPNQEHDSSTNLSSASTIPVSAAVEVALPMPVSHAWVAYACRSAGVAKPRWDHVARVWTTSAKGESGAHEAISITHGSRPQTVKVVAEWRTIPADSRRDTMTTRRLVTAFMTGMQWAVKRRTPLGS